jgi:hypothetical protein
VSTLETKPFLDDGKSAVHGLRRALAAVLESVGADPDQPQDISRRFDLDKTLTWRISRVVREEDAWEAVQHIPRRPSFGLLLKAMERHGASNVAIEGVWKALDEFERFVETHSGDRETLEIMSSAASKRSTEKRLEAFRKSGYQANSAIWGVRAKLQVACNFMTPGRKPGLLNMATICGLMDFRRLRANTPWAVATMRGWHGEDLKDTEYLGQARPLRTGLAGAKGLLLPQFCSDPLPEIEVVEVSKSTHRYMIKPGPVGNTAAASVFLGWAFEDAATDTETFAGESGDHMALVSTPVEELVHDFFVHRSLEYAKVVSSHLYSQLPGGPLYPAVDGPGQLLPVASEVSDLGHSPPDTTLIELPQYHQMVALGAENLGYPMEEFQAFRYRLSYPPIPTASVIRHPLKRGPRA